MEGDVLPDNATGIMLGIARARREHYVIPSVDQVFAAGIPLDQVNQSLLFDGLSFTPATISPITVNGLYYNFSTLWPQLDLTGPIFDETDDVSRLAPTVAQLTVQCTPEVCSLLFGWYLYLPNIPANAFFAALFGLALLTSLPLSIRQRTWGYAAGLVLGLVCEVLGYIGRILIAQNDFTNNPFYIYIICLTLGPAFLSFSIYTCLAHIIVVCGKGFSRFKPNTYTYIFVSCDFVALCLQATGGALAATELAAIDPDPNQAQRGINVMIGGLAFQVFSLTLFLALCLEYALRAYHHRDEMEPTYAELRNSRRFTAFLAAQTIAIVAIFIRSVFRVVELQAGFQSRVANNEITFMVLESSMIAIATICLTALHPAIVFKDLWRQTRATWRRQKRSESPLQIEMAP